MEIKKDPWSLGVRKLMVIHLRQGGGREREREGAGLLPGGRAHNFILNGSYISYKIPAYASYFSNITNTWTFVEISVE